MFWIRLWDLWCNKYKDTEFMFNGKAFKINKDWCSFTIVGGRPSTFIAFMDAEVINAHKPNEVWPRVKNDKYIVELIGKSLIAGTADPINFRNITATDIKVRVSGIDDFRADCKINEFNKAKLESIIG